MSTPEKATLLQLLGAGGFGVLLGWFTYYVNRYRKADVQLGDLVTVVGVLGGGAILTLFPEGTDLFGAYGIGLFIGFFGYLLVLVVLVAHSPSFTAEWFLDGRRKRPEPPFYIPESVAPTQRALGGSGENSPINE
jgi:hypothetical protein